MDGGLRRVVGPADGSAGAGLPRAVGSPRCATGTRSAWSRSATAWTPTFPPGKGVGHALRIVRDCLVLPRRGEGTALAPALEFASRAIRRHAIVFVVSDFLSRGWSHAMGLCAKRHDVIAVRLLTPELALPDAGLVRVRDPESGVAAVIDTSSPRVRAAYAQRVADWRAQTERALRRANVDRMDVPVPTERGKDVIAGPILKFFRMREARGVKR